MFKKLHFLNRHSAILCLFTLVSFQLLAQNQTFTTNGTFTVPSGVTTITVEAWGGGGGGGGVSGNPAGGGGGAGGAYSRKVFTVVPSATYTVTIGAGGTAGASSGANGGNGGSTIFGSAAIMLAQGGAFGSGGTDNSTSYSGGLASLSASVGDLVRAGGNGGTGLTGSTAGGGGQGGGYSANGNNGGNNSFGRGSNGTYDATYDGGDGGEPGNGSDGENGQEPGGGGGGGDASSNTNRAGGAGGRGEVRVHWCSGPPAIPNLTFNETTNVNTVTICPGTQVGGGNENDIEVTGGANGAGLTLIQNGTIYLWEVSINDGAWEPAANGFMPTTGNIGAAQTYGNPYYNSLPQYPIYSYFNQTGVYKFRLKLSNACGTVTTPQSDEVVITVAGPTATANTNTIADNICNNQTLTLTGSSVGGGATTGAWSIVSGGGSLSSTAQTATPQNVIYTPAANFTGPVLLRLTTNTVTNSNCGSNAISAYADRNINVGAPPVITQPVNITQTCPNNVVNFPLPTISGNPTSYTFSPASGTNFNIGTTIVTLNAVNACGAAAQRTFNVTINGPGTVPTFSTLSPTLTICNGATVPALPTTSTNSITGSWNPTSISNTASGIYTFTPSVGQCAESYTVNVTITQTTHSIAGPDQNGVATCGTNMITLAANTPTNGIGQWSIYTGTGGNFSAIGSPNSTFTGVAGNTYQLIWTITNGSCPSSKDTVQIKFNLPPTSATAYAGVNQAICTPISTLVTLGANMPSVGTGTWSIVSGPSTALSQFSSVTDNLATFTPAGGTGVYILRWSITNAPCLPSTSDVTITVTATSNLAVNGDNNTLTINSGTVNIHAPTSCALIATIATTNPLSNVIGTVFVENIQPMYNGGPVVKRHYQITPTNNAPARVTLYFTQAEFDALNAVPFSPNIPINPTDAAGKSVLRIIKFNGTSNDGSGLADTYTNGKIIIDPDDNDIVWNATYNYWEVSFEVTSFSGLFATNSENIILPVKLLEFKATLQNKSDAKLDWTIAQAENGTKYELQRSNDSRTFTTIFTHKANAIEKVFTTTDFALANGTYYYRLRITDKNGSVNYSSIAIINIGSKNTHLLVYPNPVTKYTKTIQVSITNNILESYKLYDVFGRVIIQKNNINVTGSTSIVLPETIPTGSYYLHLKTDKETTIQKLVVL